MMHGQNHIKFANYEVCLSFMLPKFINSGHHSTLWTADVHSDTKEIAHLSQTLIFTTVHHLSLSWAR